MEELALDADRLDRARHLLRQTEVIRRPVWRLVRPLLRHDAVARDLRRRIGRPFAPAELARRVLDRHGDNIPVTTSLNVVPVFPVFYFFLWRRFRGARGRSLRATCFVEVDDGGLLG